MKRNIRFKAAIPVLSILLIAGIIAGYAWSETVELVTYYPTSANTGDQHVQSLTVGTDYQGTTPANGGAFIVGPVGIGTNNPIYKLDVVGSGGANQSIYSHATDGSLARLGLRNTRREWSISNYGTQFAPNGAFVIADETAGTQRLLITEAGFVGIGTTGPQGVFHVVGAPDAVSNVIFSAGVDNAGVAGVPRMRVGIETANPQAPLQVGASSLFVQDDQGGNIELGGIGNVANPVVGGMPYIDFHFGRGVAEDFNARLINRADGILDVQTSTGGAAAQTRLSIGNNIGVGTIAPQTPAPNGTAAGNLDVNDVFLRSTGQWASQTGGGGWMLVYRDDFQANATGWSLTTRTTIGGATILGGYNVAGVGTSLTKNFNLTGIPHTQIKVECDYYSMDTWDNECAYVYATGGATDARKIWCIRIPSQSEPPRVNFGGDSRYGDGVYHALLTGSHSSNTLTVTAGSNLDWPPDNESFGIDNVEVWVR